MSEDMQQQIMDLLSSPLQIGQGHDAEENFGKSFFKSLKHDEVKEPLPRKGWWLRGSSLGEVCAREEVLAVQLHKKRIDPVDGSREMYRGIGTNFHRWIQDKGADLLVGAWKCKNKIIVHDHEVICGYRTDKHGHPRVPKPKTPCPKCGAEGKFRFYEHLYVDRQHRVRGHPDGFRRISDDPMDDEILEFKTSVEFAWKNQKEPFDSYQKQVQVYLWLTGLKRARIIMVNKGGSGSHGGWFKEYVYGRDELVIARLKKTAIDVGRGLAENVLPHRICIDKKCERAKDCQLVNACFGT